MKTKKYNMCQKIQRLKIKKVASHQNSVTIYLFFFRCLSFLSTLNFALSNGAELSCTPAWSASGRVSGLRVDPSGAKPKRSEGAAPTGDSRRFAPDRTVGDLNSATIAREATRYLEPKRPA